MIFTDTITIFNHYKENGHDRWKRTVLTNCQWVRKIVRTVDSGGKLIKTPEVKVTIPYRGDYISAATWAKLPDKTGFWTIDTEHGLDMLVLGGVPKELSENYTPKMLGRDYPDVITAKTLADNTNRDRLKHWKVTS